MKHGEFEISDDLVALVRHRWPLRYSATHPDALGRKFATIEGMPGAFMQVGGQYLGVLCCGSEQPSADDPFAECGARIIPDDFRGLLNHLLTFHGYRMDGNRYDNQNRIIGHARDHWGA